MYLQQVLHLFDCNPSLIFSVHRLQHRGQIKFFEIHLSHEDGSQELLIVYFPGLLGVQFFRQLLELTWKQIHLRLLEALEELLRCDPPRFLRVHDHALSL